MDFSFLDAGEFKEKYASDFAQTKVCFFVGGIRCEKCIRKLEGLVESTPGLRRLRVEFGKKLVHVELEPDTLSFSRIAEIIEAQGFEPIPIGREEEFVKAENAENRRNLIRLAVAGACAGNIMTFAFATYFGGDAVLFSWLSFFLYLPVVSYVAWPFYVGAWRALLSKQVSIDLPMAVASLAGFAFSTVELIRSNVNNIYFDSLSGFLFLILVARQVQRSLQRKFLRPEELTEGMKLDRVRVQSNNAWSWRPLKELRKKDRFRLESAETVPADAQLLSQYAQFSLAWLTGESKSKTFLRGGLVPAGSRLLSKEAEFETITALRETEFGQILEQAQKFSLDKNPVVLASDRWAQWLVTSVFSVAAIFLVLYWSVSPEEAIRRALALIVLACPCAMAFGTPLALAVTLRKARSAGLIVNDAGVFDAICSVRKVFFDKTGTLTDTELTLRNVHEVPEVQRPIILALENQSFHPIAFGFRKAFSHVEPGSLDDLREIPGVGVSGRVDGRIYELRALPRDANGVSCGLFENGRCLNEFYFDAALKPGAKVAISTLRAMGKELALLSGDNALSVAAFAQQLGFKENEIHSNLSPEAKASVIARAPAAMMIGDGANDSLALMKASVGVATSGGVSAALKSAKVFLANPSLEGVLTLFKISHEARSLIRQNLMISAAYNLVGGTLALLGFINPFVAAVLMPISSGFILFSTWLRSRG